MLQLPADGEGLAWIDSHEPGKLLLVPGLQAASITAAAAGDEQALAFLRFIAQHFAGSPALHNLTALQAFCQAALPERTSRMDRSEWQRELDTHDGLRQVYATRLSHTHGLLHQAVTEGRLASLQWLLGLCHPTENREDELMEEAAAQGQLDIMKHLVTGPFAAFPYDILTAAAADHPACLKWLLAQPEGCSLSEGALENIAGRGDLDTLVWLHDNGHVTQDSWTVEVTCKAAISGNVALLRWLRQLSPPCPWGNDCTDAAADRGDLAMLQWLRSESPPCPWDWSRCTVAAARIGNLELLEWLRSQDLGAPWGVAPTAAAVWEGNLPVLIWLDARGCAFHSCLQIAWLVAANRGFKHVLQWLHTKKIPWDDQIADSLATTVPRVPILMFLGDIGHPLEPEVQEQLLVARKTLCTYYSLLRWCRRAVSDPSRMTQLAFDHTCPDNSGQRLLVHMSRLPEELARLIAIKAGLQHDLVLDQEP